MRRGLVHAQEIEEGDEGTLVAGMEASLSNFCFLSYKVLFSH